MKGLFIVFHGFAAHNGISKKIFYQCDALRRCGAELRLCSLEVGADGSHRRILDGETLENFGQLFGQFDACSFAQRLFDPYQQVEENAVACISIKDDRQGNPKENLNGFHHAYV